MTQALTIAYETPAAERLTESQVSSEAYAVPHMPKQPPRSALVDLVMKDATEDEKAEATHYWYEYLGVLADIVARRRRERNGETTPDAPPELH